MVATKTSGVAASTSDRLPLILAGIYAVIWVIAAIHPLNRQDWLIENLLVILAIGALVWAYRQRTLSNISYILITLFMATHAVGAHYTYAEAAPGYWMKEWFGSERNHYDRVIHFSYGLLLALPCRELVEKSGGAKQPWSSIYAASLIFGTSGFYEVMEWLVAAVVSPDTGAAYLGTQGDEFDAQKDMALAMIGSVIALFAAGAVPKKAAKRRRTART